MDTNHKKNTREIGAKYEKRAADHLQKLGYRILCRNYRCRAGEIDLIAEQGNTLVFVEVKYRSDGRRGWAAEAVDARKQTRIIRAARWYLAEKGIEDGHPCRFDVVAIDGEEIQVIADAFWT